MDDWIGPITLRFFTGQIFEEGMQTGEPTVDGRGAQPCGDLMVSKAIDILGCYRFGPLAADDVDEDMQVATVVLLRGLSCFCA